jgi:hypothetical protein
MPLENPREYKADELYFQTMKKQLGSLDKLSYEILISQMASNFEELFKKEGAKLTEYSKKWLVDTARSFMEDAADNNLRNDATVKFLSDGKIITNYTEDTAEDLLAESKREADKKGLSGIDGYKFRRDYIKNHQDSHDPL